MNKPLTKEEREEFELCAGNHPDWIPLLSAEAFWREAVRKCDPELTREEYGSIIGYTCFFCAKQSDGEIVHADDCPWRLANET